MTAPNSLSGKWVSLRPRSENWIDFDRNTYFWRPDKDYPDFRAGGRHCTLTDPRWDDQGQCWIYNWHDNPFRGRLYVYPQASDDDLIKVFWNNTRQEWQKEKFRRKEPS
jgi:hypothetical protein